MSVKIGNCSMSTPCYVPGGSPQGSILGNYLFCVTTNDLTSNIDFTALTKVSFESMSHDTSNDCTFEDDQERNERIENIEERDEEFNRTVGHTYNDSALDESINFYRIQQRREFDSDDSVTNQTYTQSQINNRRDGFQESRTFLHILTTPTP